MKVGNWHVAAVAALSLFIITAQGRAAASSSAGTQIEKPAVLIAFPMDPAVLDAKRDLGAKGDGVADDTDALQRGLDQSCGINAKQSKVLFLPNGAYRVTQTLVVKSALGPWLYGESRDGTVIRLADGAKDCKSAYGKNLEIKPPGKTK